MCGIAGVIGREQSAAGEEAAAIRAMTDALAHRGPDGAGHFTDGLCALGHRRLAIIDLSDHAAQPMRGDGGSVLTFNGEIYNYQDLRRRLGADDGFRTDSDTEVLLKAWERWGQDCLHHLVGMFAFAVWDPRRRELTMVRDRLGKKPLYYVHDGRFLAFASEIKSLMALPEVAGRAAVDPLAVSDYLSLGYILTPKTIFANVKRLPAASVAVFHADDGRLELRSYWDLEDVVNQPRRPYDNKAREQFDELLEDAVRLRLRADVPVGLFLSGGLDSSAIAAVMARINPGGTRAYCVGFAEKSYDESGHARAVADHLGIPLTVLESPDPDPALVQRLASFYDEPFADTSSMPTFLLNASARREITVALSGDGGDEILAGYVTYRANRYRRVASLLPRPVLRGLDALARASLRPRYGKVGWDYKARQFLSACGHDAERAHYMWRQVFPDHQKMALMSDDLQAACADYDPFEHFADWFRRVPRAPFLDRTLFVDIKTWLQDDILVKADRMSMANSLEVRSPFLDHRLVEFMAGLHPAAKMDGLRQKAILKDVMAARLPSPILGRAKSGFGAPTLALGCTGLPPDAAPELFQADFRLDPRREDITYKGFALSMLQAWLATNKSPAGGLRRLRKKA